MRLSASESSRVLFDVRITTGRVAPGDRAELGDRHLEIGQDLEQQRLRLDLDAVDFVDQQHDRLGGPDGFEQRTFEQERLGEDVGLDIGPLRLVLTVGLDAEELLLVVPLVQRLRLVETLVALQSDEARAGRRRDRLRELRLADTGRTLDEHRLLEPVGEEDDPGDVVVGQVLDVTQPADDVLDRLETIRHFSPPPVRRPTPRTCTS